MNSRTPVTEADLAELPTAAQRYLRAMGVIGRPRAWSFQARYTGLFRLWPGGHWMPMKVWQYNSALPPARMMRMRLRLARVLLMTGWDTYQHGRGRMRGKLLGLVPVANGTGPEFDVGELVTWLNDAVLFAPSMLLNPATTWTAASTGNAFDVAVVDGGHRVQARVMLDTDGRPHNFSTTDRWAALPGGLVRAPWMTPVTGWQIIDVSSNRPACRALVPVVSRPHTWRVVPPCSGRRLIRGEVGPAALPRANLRCLPDSVRHLTPGTSLHGCTDGGARDTVALTTDRSLA